MVAGPAPARQPGRADLAVRSDLFGQITIYTVADDALDDFDRLTRRCVALAREREPDTLVYIAHGVPTAPGQRIIYQVFRSRAAYQRHLAQPYIRQFEQDHRPLVVSANVVELGLQQAAVAPFPSVTELFGDGFDTSGFERPDYLRDYGRDPETTPAGHAGAGAPGAGSAGLASTDSGSWEPW
jgi:quinol monooxygenase YgiN